MNILLIGEIVTMLRPQQMGQKIIGTGKVVDLRLPSSSDNVVIPTHNVPVVVSAVESSAEGVISVGQLVLWPREQIVLPRTRSPSSTNAMIHNQDVEQPSKLPSPVSDVDPSAEDDGLMNYALQCIQLGTVLMQLNDTEKEGDGERSLINWKIMMLYFRSRTRGAKYAYEAMRFITFVKALYTERMAHRILHGQFVNEKGGSGNNCANDLRMEMLVKTNKNILQGMCGNKTLTAVQRSTRAAHGLEKIVSTFDEQCGGHPDSTSHTDTCNKDDIKDMIKILHGIKAFDYQPGRKMLSFPNAHRSPLEKLNIRTLHDWLNKHKKRLAKNPLVGCDEDDADEEDDEEDNEDDEEDYDHIDVNASADEESDM